MTKDQNQSTQNNLDLQSFLLEKGKYRLILLQRDIMVELHIFQEGTDTTEVLIKVFWRCFYPLKLCSLTFFLLFFKSNYFSSTKLEICRAYSFFQGENFHKNTNSVDSCFPKKYKFILESRVGKPTQITSKANSAIQRIFHRYK